MTITKKKDKYYCRFQINGERHHYLCSGASSVKEAEKIEAAMKYKIMQQQNGVIPRELKNITVSKLFNMFLDYSRVNKKSYNTDVSRVKLILQYFNGQTYIKDITPEKLEKFKTFLLSMGRSKSTVNRYFEVLGKAFQIAVDNEYLQKNPCKTVKKFAVQNYSVRYLTKEEEEKLYKVLPEHLKPIVTVALNTGLRKANILNLKWEQINFDFNFIEVLENKGNKHIYLPLNKTLLDLFNSIPYEKRNGYVFVNPETNKPYTDIKKAWTNSLKKANIENFRFHDLRHTVGTRLAEQLVPVNVIKELLAHSDIKTTMRYVHCTNGAKLEALSKLDLYN